jgi:hypothetical protein
MYTEPETNFSTSNALFSQNGFYTASGSSDATYLLIHPTSTSITVYKGHRTMGIRLITLIVLM